MLNGDLYEILQVSPKADQDTIHRVYRLLAQRLHPDNAETGDPQAFRELIEAYQVLSHPQRRAEYDRDCAEARQNTWKVLDETLAHRGFTTEQRKREKILRLLYDRRIAEPHQPSIGLQDMSGLIGVPKDQLEFSLWFLKSAQYIERSDNGRHFITAKGVHLAEQMVTRRNSRAALLTASAAYN